MATKKAKKAKKARRISTEAPENVASRQRDYKKRRRQHGEVRVSVWVPKEHAQSIRDQAERLRAKAVMQAQEAR